jgi:hypothetical protein
MKIEFANDLQVYIAQLLWAAESMEKVEEIRSTYGKEAEVAYSMILAETLDSIDDTSLADTLLTDIFNK